MSSPHDSQASKPKNCEKRPTRGRPPKIDSKVLLQVAREVFLEHGIQATTLEVAKRAGVSEGILFHRFKTKHDLFASAMQLTEDELPQQVLQAIDSVSALDLDEMLHELASAFLRIGKVGVPLMMMSWSNPTCGVVRRNVEGFRAALKRLTGLFEGEMAKGRMRTMDPEIVARTFVGAIHHYCMSRVTDPDATWTVPESIFIRGLVDMVLYGIEQKTEPTLPSAYNLRSS